MRLVGTFTFGPIKLGGSYEKIKRDGFGATAEGTGSRNVVWTFGNNQLIYQHAEAKDGGDDRLVTQPDCKIELGRLAVQLQRAARSSSPSTRRSTTTTSRPPATSAPTPLARSREPRPGPEGRLRSGLRHMF